MSTKLNWNLTSIYNSKTGYANTVELQYYEERNSLEY